MTASTPPAVKRFRPVTGDGVPYSPLPFSPGVRANGFVFVSGQASVDEAGRLLPGTVEEEVRRTFDRVRRVLAAAGLGFDDVVQVRSYLERAEDFETYNRIYRELFREPYPARTTLFGCLGGLVKFEVDVVALDGSGTED